MSACSEQPLVSIIMPAHNAASYIGEAIASVIRQTYPHWQLLVIDDDSSDDTGAIVASFEDPRIVYEKVARIGSPSGVRNVGLKKAEGEFIAFLDADDVYFDDTLQMLLEPLLKDESATAVFGFSDDMDQNGRSLPNPIELILNQDGTYSLPHGYQKNWQHIVTGNTVCLLAALMLRRSTLQRVGLFNEALCGPEDYEFYLRLFLDNFNGVKCLPRYVYRYRIHSQSLTKTADKMQRVLESGLQIMRWLFSEAPNVPAEVYAYKAHAIGGIYRYYGRERLIHNQPQLTQKLVWLAFNDPDVTKAYWIKECLPLLLRSCLPFALNEMLIELRWTMRNRFLSPIRRYQNQFFSASPYIIRS